MRSATNNSRLSSVAVVGAGIFGVTAALELRRLGFAVTLYESRSAILDGATARSLFRIHRGFHYPRDEPTARQARDGYDSFLSTYSAAVRSTVAHYYAIPEGGSRTSAQGFQSHCQRLGLRAEPVELPPFITSAIAACWQVDEPYFDPRALRRMALDLLQKAGVDLVLHSCASADSIASQHDYVVLAVYSATNRLLAELGCQPVLLQYELCEVPVIHSPRMRDCSVVVMDGPFVSVAPYGEDCHLLYDVRHSVHSRVIGVENPEFPRFAEQLAGQPVSGTPVTKFSKILASAKRFVSSLDEVSHLGSLFSVRVVPPGAGRTDARPTAVRWVSPRVIMILSGKMSVCVDAAQQTGRAILQALASTKV